MSFEKAEAGACGTIIFWKQVGQSSCVPLVLEAAGMGCPHTGQANLNSLIALAKTIPHPTPRDNVLLMKVLFVCANPAGKPEHSSTSPTTNWCPPPSKPL